MVLFVKHLWFLAQNLVRGINENDFLFLFKYIYKERINCYYSVIAVLIRWELFKKDHNYDNFRHFLKAN
jgi:hypothetical protein